MADDEPLDVCPYDRSHQILRTRMPYHIMRCAKNYPNAKFKYCPYDRRHLLNPKEYNSHIESCPAKEFSVQTTEKENIEKQTFETPGIIPIQPFAAFPDAPIERWGVDEVLPSPLKSIQATNSQTQQFASPLIGGSKNQRKRHRLRQRRLAQELVEDVDFNQKEKQKQENNGNSQDNKETSQTALQSASNKQNTSADLSKKPPTAESMQNISSSSIKAEAEILNISKLVINSEKNATSEKQNSDVILNSRPKICTFSYAAALSSKNKQATNITSSKTATNLNSLLKSKTDDTLGW